MAKFLKSIFQPSDTRRTISYDGSGSSEEDRGDHPPMDGRRKLSISRSGRMKQAQKKRLSLTLDIYGGEDDLQQHERPKSIEYHVNPITPTRDAPTPNTKQRRRSGESRASADSAKVILRGQGNQITVVAIPRKVSADMRSPDEEIDNAFGVIDKL